MVVVVQSLNHVWLFVIPWTAHTRLLCPPLSPGVCSNSCPLSQWCYPTISSSAIPFSFAFNVFQHQGLRTTMRYHLTAVAAAAAKSLPLCPTLCNPIDGSPPGFLVSGILQARTLEWVAISFSNVWKWKVKVKSLCCAGLFMTPWTAAYQAPPSMGFSSQEYWSGVPLPSPTSLHSSTFKIDIFVRDNVRCICKEARLPWWLSW